MARIFGNSELLARTKTNREFSEILYNAISEGLDYNRANADLMVNRVKLLLWINNEELKTSLKIAAQGLRKVRKSRKSLLLTLPGPVQQN